MHIIALSDGNVTSATGSGTVVVQSGHVGAVYIQANAANSVTLVLRRDGAAGKIIFDESLNATTGGPFTRWIQFSVPLSMEATTDLYWALTSGAGTAEAMIYEWVG